MEAWYTLARLPLADHLLSRTGAGWRESKDIVVSVDWVSTLRWGLDHYAFITYLIRGRRLVAATLSARMFLERWTLNVADYHDLTPHEGESDADFITRTWDCYKHISADHDMGRYWKLMSEHLHGRPTLEDTVAADGTTIAQFLVTVSGLALQQVLGAIQGHADANGLAKMADKLYKSPVNPKSLSSWNENELIAKSLHQLDFVFTNSDPASLLSFEADGYRRLIDDPSNGRAWRDSFSLDHAVLAFVERRGRAIDVARNAFAREAQVLGDDFSPGSLNARLYRYIGIGEVTRLLATEAPTEHERRALSAAADALESAWYVWLEDSDLSLGCIRVLLEQTSRARAHRLKRNRAERLENLGVAAAPTRWLELAGFKRLASYNRALGQFAHIRLNLQLDGARTLLERLQPAPGEHAKFTTRGEALNEGAYLLAHEVAARLDQVAPSLTELFRMTVTLTPAEDHEAALADMLDRSLGLRETNLGPSIFRRPTAEERAAQ